MLRPDFTTAIIITITIISTINTLYLGKSQRIVVQFYIQIADLLIVTRLPLLLKRTQKSLYPTCGIRDISYEGGVVRHLEIFKGLLT